MASPTEPGETGAAPPKARVNLHGGRLGPTATGPYGTARPGGVTGGGRTGRRGRPRSTPRSPSPDTEMHSVHLTGENPTRPFSSGSPRRSRPAEHEAGGSPRRPRAVPGAVTADGGRHPPEWSGRGAKAVPALRRRSRGRPHPPITGPVVAPAGPRVHSRRASHSGRGRSRSSEKTPGRVWGRTRERNSRRARTHFPLPRFSRCPDSILYATSSPGGDFGGSGRAARVSDFRGSSLLCELGFASPRQASRPSGGS